MFKINKESNFDLKEKLLYNIWQELKTGEQNKQKTSEYKCKTCGEKFNNKGKLLVHYKSHKKGE